MQRNRINIKQSNLMLLNTIVIKTVLKFQLFLKRINYFLKNPTSIFIIKETSLIKHLFY